VTSPFVVDPCDIRDSIVGHLLTPRRVPVRFPAHHYLPQCAARFPASLDFDNEVKASRHRQALAHALLRRRSEHSVIFDLHSALAGGDCRHPRPRNVGRCKIHLFPLGHSDPRTTMGSCAKGPDLAPRARQKPTARRRRGRPQSVRRRNSGHPNAPRTRPDAPRAMRSVRGAADCPDVDGIVCGGAQGGPALFGLAGAPK